MGGPSGYVDHTIAAGIEFVDQRLAAFERGALVDVALVDGHEITDKGYINQRATLDRRKALVEKLYAGGDGVIEIN